MDFVPFMHLALAEAKNCGVDVPVGAVLIDKSGSVISIGKNTKEEKADPTGHAEIEAIRAASQKLGDWRLSELTLVVTLEPCLMCAAAIVAARIPRVVFGTWDEKLGGSGSLYDITRDPRLGKPIEVISGVLEQECAKLLTDFFEARR